MGQGRRTLSSPLGEQTPHAVTDSNCSCGGNRGRIGSSRNKQEEETQQTAATPPEPPASGQGHPGDSRASLCTQTSLPTQTAPTVPRRTKRRLRIPDLHTHPEPFSWAPSRLPPPAPARGFRLRHVADTLLLSNGENPALNSRNFHL